MDSASGDQNKIIVRGDPEFRDLIPKYLENIKNRIDVIKEASGNNDFRKICNLGHGMKGSGSFYGFVRITELGALIELAAEKQDTEQIGNRLQELAVYLDNIEVIYE